jgi:alpha-glucosidase (family GH31 glycosyl hydrolase)
MTLLLAFGTLNIVLGLSADQIVGPASIKAATHAIWAHYHMVWLHHGVTNQQNVTDLFDGYKSRGIPVGGVNIDSGWSTKFNNFEVDTTKFPNLANLIDYLHESAARVILWVTSFVNEDVSDFQEALDKGYFLKNSKGISRVISWWHGDGCLIDYTNPEGMKWWHSKMDKVLDIGVDGWKTDASDPYIDEYELTGGAFGYDPEKKISYRDYADAYYGDFFDYTREKRGNTGLIMSRPVDCSYDKRSAGCSDFSPKNVMYAGWVGDDDSTFNGLRAAVSKLIYSAWDGYSSFGMDIGGYRNVEDGINKRILIRWAQIGAFMGLMENGGDGDHRPWTYGADCTAIYKTFAIEHHRIAPLLQTASEKAMERSLSLIQPVMKRDDEMMKRPYPAITDFAYILAEEIFVYPIVEDVTNEKFRDEPFNWAKFTLPSGNDWLDWWDPTKVYGGGTKQERRVPLRTMPVYVKKSAFLPLEASVDDPSIRFTWFGPNMNSTSWAEARELSSSGPGWAASISLSGDGLLSGDITAHKGTSGFTIVGVNEPTEIHLEGDDCTTLYSPKKLSLSITCSTSRGMKFFGKGVESLLS